MDTIAERLQAVKSRIAGACAACGRAPRDIVLVAVSKGFPYDDILAAHAAGEVNFGENYVQEALAKQARLAERRLTWHFIGPIQSNKTAALAAHFDWVHTVDRLKIAERLAAQRAAGRAPLDVCIQVNVSGELTKSGVAPAALVPLAHAVARLSRLRLRGLMAIPEPSQDAALLRCRFEMLRDLKEALVRDGIALDALSMGMSDDLEAAIAAGATMLRVGTAIFGARPTAAAAQI